MNRTKRYYRELIIISALAMLSAGAASAAMAGSQGPYGMSYAQGTTPYDAGGIGMSGNRDMDPGSNDGLPGTGFHWGRDDSRTGQDGAGTNFRGQAGPQIYESFSIDTGSDPFVDPGRFREMSGLAFVDEDGDGICDYFQDTALYRAELGLEWADENGDGIGDFFQSRQMYQSMGLGNFVDVDSDGLCDNYELFPRDRDEPDNFRGGAGPQMYPPFEVGTGDDLFVSPEQFSLATGREWVDENGDGIGDSFQDGPHFRELGLGSWTDANGDGIGDLFQTREMYWALGLHNFVDVDGDGLCDNYEQNPFAAEEEAR